jgi:transposase
MFTDEARFGHAGRRSAHGPVSPRNSSANTSICMARSLPRTALGLFDHANLEYRMLPGLLEVLARRFCRQDILLVLDGAPNHRCGDLAVPDNITLLYLPPYSPELNPKENLWDEIRENIFTNYALKSMHEVRAKLRQAILYIECNPKLFAPSPPSLYRQLTLT